MTARRTQIDVPRYYDGTQLIVRVHLPAGRTYRISEVYDHVYGWHLDDGAKPWPYYRDACTGEWWSLSTNCDTQIDALVWLLPLDQLSHKPRPQAESYLQQVLPELAAAAEQFGATAESECSPADALAKIDAVTEMLSIRNYTATIVVRALDETGFTVSEWWNACENAGLQHGDGDLFWQYNEAFSEAGTEPHELFCVEPYSRRGYFHSGDLGTSVAFVDVALYFRVRDVKDPVTVLTRMAQTAQTLADRLGALLVTTEGKAYDLEHAQFKVQQARDRLQALACAK